MRVCTKCHVSKTETEFYVKDHASNRLHTQCKACYKEHRKINYALHYEKYGDEYRERAKKYRNKIKTIYRTNMLAYLSDKACVVCGESDIRVLEFDHLDQSTKSFSISQAVRLGYSWNNVLEEIAKCRILCANCHKKRTAIQGHWYRVL
jgi:uncharacterized membrane protein YgaE (UPF0421/DUF939 family)